MSQISQTAGQQLSVEGAVYTIGTDFIVRAGNVVLAGGAVKGMLLEVRPSLLKPPPDVLIVVLDPGGVPAITCHAIKRYKRWNSRAVEQHSGVDNPDHSGC